MAVTLSYAATYIRLHYAILHSPFLYLQGVEKEKSVLASQAVHLLQNLSHASTGEQLWFDFFIY
jgi:hypothetical protein